MPKLSIEKIGKMSVRQLRKAMRDQLKSRQANGRLGGVARAKNLSQEELSEIGRKGGKVGGQSRAEKLTPERRREIAKAAAAARWGKSGAKR